MGSQNWLWQCLTPILNFKDLYGFSVLDMMESREISIHVWVIVTDQITEVDWQAEQPSEEGGGGGGSEKICSGDEKLYSFGQFRHYL